MKLRLMAGTVLLAAMMIAPSSVAVHGSAYTATGVAYVSAGVYTPVVGWLGPIGVPAGAEVYDATVEWGGFWTHAYTVTLKDAVTGAIVVQQTFPGAEQWGCCVYGNYEFFQYHGCSAAGWTCLPTGATPDFDIYGLQTINIQTGATAMLYEGWFNEYALILYVDDYF